MAQFKDVALNFQDTLGSGCGDLAYEPLGK